MIMTTYRNIFQTAVHHEKRLFGAVNPSQLKTDGVATINSVTGSVKKTVTDACCP